MTQLNLSKSEISLLIQSLDHCLATCQDQKTGKGGLCRDCEAAKALRTKLSDSLPA